MSKKVYIISVFVVFFVAALFRFYKLTSYPVSSSIDEVGFGFNAYSILATGKDEWGDRYPIVFRAIDDFKPAVDVYLTAPSVAIFGLNELGVRFPVAFLGTITVIIFIFLLRERKFSKPVSIFTGLWFATSPWHVTFSRANYEASIALFFLIFGIWMFILWSKNFSIFVLTLSLSALSLSVWSYNAERLFTPILFFFLVFIFREKILKFVKNPKRIVLPIAILLLFILPFLYLAFFSEAIKTRPLSTSIFREANLVLAMRSELNVGFIDSVFNSDLYLVFRHWAGKYINYFDLRFWFWKGMGFTPGGYPDIGLFHLIDAPFILYGIYILFRNKDEKFKGLSFAWLFLGPLAASLATNEQHALRSLVWLPFFGFAMASGLGALRKLSFIYIVLLPFVSLYYANLYSIQYPRFYSEYWQYGYKDIANYACKNKDNYKEIVITDTFGSYSPENTGIPYAYILFYCKYNPDEFLRDNRKIDKFSFRRVDWENDSKRENTMLIGSVWDFPSEGIPEKNILKKIYFLNDKLGFIVAKSNGE